MRTLMCMLCLQLSSRFVSKVLRPYVEVRDRPASESCRGIAGDRVTDICASQASIITAMVVGS